MYHDDAALSMEAGDLEQVLGTLRQQALDIEARYCDQVLTTTTCIRWTPTWNPAPHPMPVQQHPQLLPVPTQHLVARHRWAKTVGHLL